MRILREQTAGLVIDIQERLFPYISGNEEMTRNSGILIQGLQVLGIPILVTQQYTKGLGATVEPIRALFPGMEHIEKTAFSCCDDPGFMEHLSALKRKYIVITGIESHVCVLQTTIDLLHGGFVPVVVEDCVSSRKENDKKQAIRRMHREGAVITTSESLLFELLRYSGTEEFKAISKLVK